MFPVKAIQNLISKSDSKINHLLICLNKIENEDLETTESLNKLFDEILELQVKKDIPILTLNLSFLKEELIIKVLDHLNNNLKNQVRVLVIGNWYSSDGIIEPAKKLINNTDSYDKHFLNLLVNYSGKREIFSSLQLIIKKLITKKINLKELNMDIIKENIYSSYFITPNIIIETGKNPKFSGSFLWDSEGSCIYFTKESWAKLSISEIQKAEDFCNL